MSTPSESAYALGAAGPFAAQDPGFKPREAQLEMAVRVEQALAARETVVIEAGTGTGKTFAYLVPALLSGERVIVSTGTRNLQDQLYHRDLPNVCKTLKVFPKRALLKGRSNYLCRQRYDETKLSGRLPTKDAVRDLQIIARWLPGTHSGDLAEVAALPEDSALLPMVTSSNENCLGGDCPQYQECFVVQARRTAMEADVVVVNHHLLLADLALKEEGFGELLPGAAAIIIDEAHQLAETATNFFGVTLSSRQINELLRDTESAYLIHARDQAEIGDALRRVQKAAQDFRLALGADKQRAPLAPVMARPDVQRARDELFDALLSLREPLIVAAPRSEILEQCLERVEEQLARWKQIISDTGINDVRWFETYRNGFSLNSTPLSVAEPFQRQIQRYQGAAWIYTSATLAVNRGFAHFTGQLGLNGAATLALDSPFRYREQALMYVPNLPTPDQPQFNAELLRAVLPVLAASRGRAFLLFTSYRALEWFAQELPKHVHWPVLVQGSLPRNALIERFRQLGNAVLLGTSSFWEGVDVRGDALSVVIIDRLPFAAPDDPVLKARVEACRRQGGEPFGDLQLPRAVIALKQGAGRLIRDVDDRGVLMIADNRLLTKNYGRVFLASLPSMPMSRDLRDVQDFFQAPASELAF